MTVGARDLDGLDPDDSRPASKRIAGVLRTAIRAGRFGPGDRLPPQLELAERYGVARETVKSALRILRDEQLIVSRQGSGVFVRARTDPAAGLRAHVAAAFAQSHVSIDFSGVSGETLRDVVEEPLAGVRAGRLIPKSITIRILVPDVTRSTVVPARADQLGYGLPDGDRPRDGSRGDGPPRDGSWSNGPPRDDVAVPEHAAGLSHPHTDAIVAAVTELATRGLVRDATAEIRSHGATVLSTLYIVNRREVFFGLCPVVRGAVMVGGQVVPVLEAVDRDAALLHCSADAGNQFVEQSQTWFDSLWDTIAR
ncbi:winged helix-turn-helix domain-containing protein [Actinoplanes rectilineatus]|uniref:winged helix-turn-helix domain-containing protein n=1 Tax=Actinoplanes rectilineatus TaxID=113571 RepID=UPI0005F29557|nr:winged helix-turn-helix domain-containing protein [Actinoplanes rectilineatus]